MMKIGEYVGDRIDWLFDFIGWCIGFILKAVFLAGWQQLNIYSLVN